MRDALASLGRVYGDGRTGSREFDTGPDALQAVAAAAGVARTALVIKRPHPGMNVLWVFGSQRMAEIGGVENTLATVESIANAR